MKYLMKDIEIKCPVCHQMNGTLLYTVNSEESAQRFILSKVNEKKFNKLLKNIEKLWKRKVCDIVECKECQFVYSYPFISGDSEFYSLAYDGIHYPNDKWEFIITKDSIKKIVDKSHTANVKLLEVGAGNGSFLSQICPEIINPKNVLATEYSEFGIKEITNKGIKTFSKDIRELPEEYNNSFDIICMFQVLEHMDNLEGLFKKITQITKKNATLFIAVPNGKRVEFDEQNGALLDMPPNHISRWSKISLEALAKKNGFQVVNYKEEPFNFLRAYRTLVYHRYIRKTLNPFSIFNTIERNKQKRMINFLRKLIIIYLSLISTILIPKMLERKSGNAQWIQLIKIDCVTKKQRDKNLVDNSR